MPEDVNVSIVLRGVMGKRESDGSFSGCYGSVHDNTSDFPLAYFEYPTQDYERVFPFQILKESGYLLGGIQGANTFRLHCQA